MNEIRKLKLILRHFQTRLGTDGAELNIKPFWTSIFIHENNILNNFLSPCALHSSILSIASWKYVAMCERARYCSVLSSCCLLNFRTSMSLCRVVAVVVAVVAVVVAVVVVVVLIVVVVVVLIVVVVVLLLLLLLIVVVCGVYFILFSFLLASVHSVEKGKRG